MRPAAPLWAAVSGASKRVFKSISNSIFMVFLVDCYKDLKGFLRVPSRILKDFLICF